MYFVSQKARAAEQNRTVDGRKRGSRNGTASDPTGAFGQKAEAGKGAFGGRKGKSTVAAFGQRAAETVLRAGIADAFMRTISPELQRGRSSVLSRRARRFNENASASGAQKVKL